MSDDLSQMKAQAGVKMTTESVRVYSTNDPDEGMRLVGAMVSANVANATATTNALIENLESQILGLAKLVVEMSEAFEDATVVDRKTENRFRAFEHRIDNAHNLYVRVKNGESY